ncbi:MAG TPA: tyrosine-protein phosphatase [Bryobacteraceae bacterium]|jgi:protein tyrosine/serine phosphatase
MRPVLAVFAVLFSALPLTLAADATAPHVRNFGEVNDHLYRGGEPSLVGLEELAAQGVKLVIDLRENGKATDFEKIQVKKLGMKYVNLPLRPFSAPTQGQMEQALSLLLQSNSQTVFVHCRRGKDRTGTVIACYRIEHDRWTNSKALEEAKEYGMSSIERAMRSYVAHFSPLPIPELVKIGK